MKENRNGRSKEKIIREMRGVDIDHNNRMEKKRGRATIPGGKAT